MKGNKLVSWQRNRNTLTTLEEFMGMADEESPITDMDLQFLEALLRYNFLTNQLSKRLWQLSLKHVSSRFQRLYEWALVDRAIIPRNQRGSRQIVYTLSKRGFDLLTRMDSSFARNWVKDWMPRSATGSQRLSISHELGCNEVCIALSETAQALKRPVTNWEGPRETTLRFSTSSGWHTLNPDAILTLENGQPLFIEFEQSGRDNKLQTKARLMRTYLLSGQWQERYPREPWIIYAIPLGMGTQGVVGGSYGGVIVRANMSGARNYLILDEYSWSQGTWMATKADGSIVKLWDVI